MLRRQFWGCSWGIPRVFHEFRVWETPFFLSWEQQGWIRLAGTLQRCFRCKFELVGPKRPVWHTRVLPRIAMQQYGDKNKFKWWNKFYYFLQFARVSGAKQAAWDSRVQICIENCIPEMPLSRQLVQILGRSKFSIRFQNFCWILRVSPRTPMAQNQAQSNYKDCSFGNRHSFVKGTRLSVLILAKSHASQ